MGFLDVDSRENRGFKNLFKNKESLGTDSP